MKPPKKDKYSNKIGRRGMLKSVFAATASMGFGTITGMDKPAEFSEISDAVSRPEWRPVRALTNIKGPLTMQPVLVYQIPERKEGASWRTWSGLITEDHAEEFTYAQLVKK